MRLLQRMLERGGYTTFADTTDSTQTLQLCHDFHPDLICLDLRMPGLDGLGVLAELQPLFASGDYLPVLMLTGDLTTDSKHRALAIGATDFLTKPFNSDEVLLRLHNLLVPRFMYLALKRQNASLEERVQLRTFALEESRIELLDRLACAAEFRDDNTAQHTRRVGTVAALLAEAAGLGDEAVTLLRMAAPLHDVGKIGISDRILLKPGTLTAEEFETMKSHTVIGGEILANGQTTLIRVAQEIALNHHERWDGSGYPAGRAGLDIPLFARIVAVADVFDALTHARPYRDAWPFVEVMDEMARLAGHQFDPELTRLFFTLPLTPPTGSPGRPVLPAAIG